jgi:cell wall-associated NlpC family hydrolase
VQVSAYPDRYAQHTADAGGLLGTGTGGAGALGTVSDGSNAATDFGANKADAQSVFDSTFATDNGKSDPDYMQPAVGQTDSNTAGVGHYAAPMSMMDLPDDSAFQIPHGKDGGLDLSGLGGGPGGAGGPWRQDIRQFAKKFLGTPYVWGGTTPQGFDCSGFVQYVYKHALGMNLPRISADQARYGPKIALKNLRVGDLVGWNNSSRNNGADHIAIYIGHGRIIEAPRPGLSVQISNLYDQNIAWGVRMRHG